jgi:poly-gamma-glutamate synthesis protein (capsule biosynthesis protein)
VIIAVPARWLEAIAAAFAEAPSQAASWRWQLVADDEPLRRLESGEADLALASGATAVPTGRRPLAVAVPFATFWETTTLAEAQAIQTTGHSLARVVDWADVPPGYKALRVDGLLPFEPGYPLYQPWALASRPGLESAAEALAPLAAVALGHDPLVHIAAVGDVMLDRTLGNAIAAGNIDYPLANFAPLLAAADIALANLESALGDQGAPATKSYTFRAPPAAALALANAGIDVVSLANNHALDYGPDALLQAVDLLNGAGVTPIGGGPNAAVARSPHIVTVNGLTLAFLAYVHVPVEGGGFDTQSWTATADSAGLAWAEPAVVAADVAAAAARADHVIVMLHSGYEYVAAPSPPQVAAAQAAIDAGATLVIGHHAHILQGVHFYGEGVIVYGLGNFAFTIDGPPETALLNVWLGRAGIRHVELVPAIVQPGGQPRLATPDEAAAIRQQLYRLTNALNGR